MAPAEAKASKPKVSSWERLESFCLLVKPKDSASKNGTDMTPVVAADKSKAKAKIAGDTKIAKAKIII